MNQEKDKTKFNFAALKDRLSGLSQYRWLALLLFLAITYGYVLYNINVFSNQQPTASQISSYQKTTAMPSINPEVVSRLDKLKNNSVSVKALLNQGRQNPFQ